MDGLRERGTRVRDATSYDDVIDVVGHDQEMDRPGQPATDVVDELAGGGVAAGRGGVDVLGRAGLEPGGDGSPGDRGTGGEGLEAARLAAGAARAVRVGDGVADLAGQAAGAAVEPAVEDDAGRDAGADREVGEIAAIDPGRGAAAVQAEGGGTGVVLDHDRSADFGFECAAEIEVGPA